MVIPNIETPETDSNNEMVKPEVFNNEGEYSITNVTGKQIVEKGKFLVDTRVVSQAPNEEAGEGEWQTWLQIDPDNGVLYDTDGDSEIPLAYESKGENYRLWSKEMDPEGKYAKQMHNLIIGIIEAGIPAEDIDKTVNILRLVFTHKIEAETS